MHMIDTGVQWYKQKVAAANTTAMLLDVGGNLDETVDAESEVDAIDGVLPKLMKALLTLKQFKVT